MAGWAGVLVSRRRFVASTRRFSKSSGRRSSNERAISRSGLRRDAGLGDVPPTSNQIPAEPLKHGVNGASHTNKRIRGQPAYGPQAGNPEQPAPTVSRVLSERKSSREPAVSSLIN